MLILLLALSTVDYISKISLRKRISRRKVEELLPNVYDFRAELALSYQDIGYNSTFFKTTCQFYKYADLLIEDNGVTSQCHLHIGDIISILAEDDSECFAVLRSIFSQKKDDQHFAFMVVDWFEITNQVKLECPVYRIRTDELRRVFPISIVNTNTAVHFIHYCDNSQDLYIRNLYFFKAV